MILPDIQVLVVEDDAVNALIVQKLFQEEFKIFIAKNGDEALALVNSQKFDLILMDIHLGDANMDGVEVMQQIKRKPELQKIPVFAVTSFAMPEDRKKFLGLGFDNYFSKPIQKKELLKAVIDILSQKFSQPGS